MSSTDVAGSVSQHLQAPEPSQPEQQGAGSGRPGYVAWLLLAGALHAVLFAPVGYRFIFDPVGQGPNLFPAHIEFARDMFSAPWNVFAPDALWLAVVKGIDLVLPGSILRAAFVAAVGFYALFGMALFVVFADALSKTARSRTIALGLSVAFALMESPAVYVGWDAFSAGQIFIPLYIPYSATTLASLGINVLLIWQVARLLDGLVPRNRWWTVSALTVAAALAKPNLVPLVLVVAPLMGLWRHARREPRDLRAALLPAWLVTVPGALITAGQLLATIRYVPNRGGWRVAFLAELRLLNGLTPLFWTILVVPVVLAVVYRRSLFDTAVRAAVMCSGIAIVLGLLLERVGTPYKGDALQLTQTSLAMVYIFMGRRILVLQREEQSRVVQTVCAVAAFGACLVAGLASWAHHVNLFTW
jgi:hypothetical protein